MEQIGKKAASEDLGDDGSGGLDGDDMTESERSLFLRSPLFDSRRFSDSAVCRGPTTPAITFSLTPDTSCGGDGNECNNPGILRRSSDSGPGIVLSTGDLETLKCLTSSAQEISSTPESDQTGGGTASPTNLGNKLCLFCIIKVCWKVFPGTSLDEKLCPERNGVALKKYRRHLSGKSMFTSSIFKGALTIVLMEF